MEQLRLSCVCLLIFMAALASVDAFAGEEPDAPTFTIAGWVADALDAAAVVDVRIALELPGFETHTDAQGRFTLSGVPAGVHTLHVEHAEYERLSRTVAFPSDEALSTELYLELSPLVPVDEHYIVTHSSSPLENPVGYRPDQALDAEELQRRQGTSLGEVLDGEPGVAMRSYGPAPTRPVIRGMDGDRVLVLENGERMGDMSGTAHDHAVTSDPLAAERVEIVRGPSSLLYGSSALGGVVNVLNEDIPRRWSPGLYGELSGYGASVNTGGAAGGRVIYGGDDWAMTTRLSLRRADETHTPAGPLTGSYLAQGNGSVGVAARPGNLEVGAAFGLDQHRYGLPEGFDDPTESVELRSLRHNLQARLAWKPEHPGFVEGLEWRLNAARYLHREFGLFHHDVGPPDEDLGLEFLQHTASSTALLRHGALGPIGRGAFGLNVTMRDIELGGADLLTPNSRAIFVAAFFFEEVPLTDWLRLQLGLRPEVQRIEARDNAQFPDFEDVRNRLTLSGSVGLNLRPTEGLEFGAQVARAHRAPMIEELYSNAAHLGTGTYEIGDPDLANEIGLGVDVFSRLTVGPVRAELAGFYQRVDGYVFLQPTGETDPASRYPIYRYEGAASDFAGAEFSAVWRIWRGLQLQGNVDYVRAERVDEARTPLPSIPPLRTRLGLRYEADSWWLGATTRIVATQTRTAPGERSTDGYTLQGFDAGYRLDAGGLHVLVLRLDNAFDTSYRDHLSRVEGRDFTMPGRNLSAVYRWIF